MVVLVVGIFGLFTAYHLVNEGVDVAIIEQNEPGAWSKAAAGLIEYGMFGSNFTNAPGCVTKLLRMVRSGDAAIRYVSTE
ncbi:MAG: FAD-dependent oxidoreductase [Vulcanisaeta sp.]